MLFFFNSKLFNVSLCMYVCMYVFFFFFFFSFVKVIFFVLFVFKVINILLHIKTCSFRPVCLFVLNDVQFKELANNPFGRGYLHALPCPGLQEADTRPLSTNFYIIHSENVILKTMNTCMS